LASARNGTLPNSEPRKIKTFSVRGDQSDGAATPVTSTPHRQQNRRRQKQLQRRRRLRRAIRIGCQCERQCADVAGAAGRSTGSGRSCNADGGY